VSTESAAEKKMHEVEDMVAQIDTGARNPEGWQGRMIVITAFIWALFQLYIASNLPFILQEMTGISLIVTSDDARLFHLSFAFLLAAMAYPLFKSSPRDYIPWYDWMLGLLGIASCLYIIIIRQELAERAGLPEPGDLIAATVGIIVLGVSVYRTLGLPLLIIASVFLLYVFFGHSSLLPDAIMWKGASFSKALGHFWVYSEGVFGVALKVSAELIFLFVLFGAVLEKAGAGNFFIKIAFALLGHFRGGPAKAAVVASAMSGLYSGSSIANTVTTGTFTIPLMKKTGFPAEKAGAVEVASSTNGQLMPPVMGAAAFLISEFTGVPYTELIIHALIPALVSYIALVYIVHLEAMKMDLKGLKKPTSTMTLTTKVISCLGGFIGMALIAGFVYYGLGWIKDVAYEAAFPIVVIGCSIAYLYLLWIASKYPDLEVDDPDAPITELPRAGATAITGLYYILPIVILIWSIMIERLSPGLAAFWATIAMITVSLTQHPIKAFYRGVNNYREEFIRGIHECKEGMIAGSRNMISIGIATAAAGIIIGTVSLTGAHMVVGEFVEFLSGGNLIAMLVLVALMSLVLGMGLPTTANYIVVSSLMAPVILALTAKSGLIVPLVAVHLFVFYFGILADDTPPVGLAAFAAAAISGGDPIKTGIQGFMYDIRTALLPFLFIFNTDLLLINVGPIKAFFVFGIAVIAMLMFAAATQGFMLVRNKKWETVALLLVAFTLFRPGFWLDKVSLPYNSIEPAKVYEFVDTVPAGDYMTIVVSGPDFDTSEITSTTLLIPLSDPGEAAARLESAGLTVMLDGGLAIVDEPMQGTPFFRVFTDLFDFYGDTPVTISQVHQKAERMPKELFYIPALALLGVIILLQRRRRKRETA
jgi:TRAP transporter 4TM/12TM fusion protein